MGSVTQAFKYAQNLKNTLTPEDSQSTRLTFRKFDGYALSKYALEGTPLKSSDVLTVQLAVNPESISFTQPRITQKVATNANRRFIIFDWGVDLLSMNISGNTGCLLPDSVTNKNDPSQLNLLSSINGAVGNNIVSDFISNSVTNFLNYEEIIALSPKYQKFMDLQKMYRIFDGDRDILTLEFGSKTYRGFFSNFSFDLVAATAWNYKYRIDFTVLDDLSALEDVTQDTYSSEKVDKTTTS